MISFAIIASSSYVRSVDSLAAAAAAAIVVVVDSLHFIHLDSHLSRSLLLPKVLDQVACWLVDDRRRRRRSLRLSPRVSIVSVASAAVVAAHRDSSV